VREEELPWLTRAAGALACHVALNTQELSLAVGFALDLCQGSHSTLDMASSF
jgi:hypothetical protein